MKIKFSFQNIDFEWDSQKASLNFKKHRIFFETACEVFHDPFLRVVDEESADREQREAVIGMTVDWRLLYVVYTLRGDVIRIISARLVTKPERKKYEEQ